MLALCTAAVQRAKYGSVCDALKRPEERMPTSAPKPRRPVRLSRLDAFGVFEDYVCQQDKRGTCIRGLCTLNKREIERMRGQRLHRLFGYDERAEVYTLRVANQTGVPLVDRFLFDPPNASLCTRPICEMGVPYDGGYGVCIDERHLGRSPDCVIYSVGIMSKVEFDVSASALGCEIHMFDHTIPKGAQRTLRSTIISSIIPSASPPQRT